MEVMSVFYNIWCNPNTTIFKIIQYLLMMCDAKSTTWAAHVRLLCMQYSLPDPLREAAKNIKRGGSLNLAAFGRKVLAPPRFSAKTLYPS